MFLYNSYKSTKPAKVDAGKRTIAWSHFSDPKVLWKTVKFNDFLRTAKNVAPIKVGQKWKVGSEPDQKATERHVKSLQTTAVIPKGTFVPKELIITKDHYIAKKKSWHYSISPNFDMPVSKFLNALDKLALNAKINIKVKSHG